MELSKHLSISLHNSTHIMRFLDQLLFNLLLSFQTWELYQKRELVGLVDISLDGHFDAEEACKFLKIGLLCTQDTSKLRPTMSSVVKMLTGENDIDESKITKPSFISDFMNLKIRGEKGGDIDTKVSSSYNASSASDSHSNTMSYAASTTTTTTFTGKYDQSL